MARMSDEEFDRETEEFREMLNDMDERNTQKDEPCHSLREMLARKDIYTLEHMGKMYGIDGIANAETDLDAAISRLVRVISSEKELMQFGFYSLRSVEWEMVKKAANADKVPGRRGFSQAYLLAISLGVLTVYDTGDEENLYYVMTDEVKDAFHNLEKRGYVEFKDRQLLLHDYAYAAVNLYGLISYIDFIALFNSQNEPKTNAKEIVSSLRRFTWKGDDYRMWKGFLINKYFEEHEYQDVETFVRASASKPRYIPPKEQFLRYRNADYLGQEPPSAKAFQDFARRALTGEEKIAFELMMELRGLCRSGVTMQECLDYLEDYGEFSFASEEQKKATREQIVALRNDTRLWINNGHTPNEIMKLMQEKKDRLES